MAQSVMVCQLTPVDIERKTPTHAGITKSIPF